MNTDEHRFFIGRGGTPVLVSPLAMQIFADSDNIYHEVIEEIEVDRGVKDSIMFAAVDGKTAVNVFVSRMKAVEGHEVGGRGIRW